MSSVKLYAGSTTASSCSTTSDFNTKYPKKVYLDVSPSTTEHQLYHVAVSFGPVRSVHIPKDKETQQSRGFAFVTFQLHEHAVAAMEDLEGSVLDGLILHPRWATPTKPAREKRNKGKRNGSRKTKTLRKLDQISCG